MNKMNVIKKKSELQHNHQSYCFSKYARFTQITIRKLVCVQKQVT